MRELKKKNQGLKYPINNLECIRSDWFKLGEGVGLDGSKNVCILMPMKELREGKEFFFNSTLLLVWKSRSKFRRVGKNEDKESEQ